MRESYNLQGREFELRLGVAESILVNKKRIELFEEIVKKVNDEIDKDPNVTVCLLHDGTFAKENDVLEMVLPFDSSSHWIDELTSFEFPNWITYVKILRLPNEKVLFSNITDNNPLRRNA